MRIVDEAILQVFRGRPCELCNMPAPSDPHHVEPCGMDNGKRLDVALNLISLCRECHQNVQEGGQRSRALCEQTIAYREGLEGPADVREAIWRLIQRPKEFSKSEKGATYR